MKNFTAIITLLLLSACGGESANYDRAAEGEYATDQADHDMDAVADTYSGQYADLVAEFNTSAEILMAAIDGVSGDQWTYRESDDRWSIAEVCEHIIMAEQGIVGGFVTNLVNSEAISDSTGGRAEMDAGVRALSRDRSDPVKTNEKMEPKGIYETPEQAIAAFEEVRAQTLEFLMTTDADLRAHTGSIAPEIDPMDAYQWLIFAAGHVERHSAQIDQVKAHEGYPAM